VRVLRGFSGRLVSSSLVYGQRVLSPTHNSGLGNDISAISPNGINASCSVSAVTWLSSPPTKTVAFSRDWSDMMRLLLCYSDRGVDVPSIRRRCKISISRAKTPRFQMPAPVVGLFQGARSARAKRRRASPRARALRSFDRKGQLTGGSDNTNHLRHTLRPFLLQCDLHFT
jgi:hypothetical protein